MRSSSLTPASYLPSSTRVVLDTARLSQLCNAPTCQHAEAKGQGDTNHDGCVALSFLCQAHERPVEHAAQGVETGASLQNFISFVASGKGRAPGTHHANSAPCRTSFSCPITRDPSASSVRLLVLWIHEISPTQGASLQFWLKWKLFKRAVSTSSHSLPPSPKLFVFGICSVYDPTPELPGSG